MSFEDRRDSSDTTRNTSSGEGIVSAEDTVSEVPESRHAGTEKGSGTIPEVTPIL